MKITLGWQIFYIVLVSCYFLLTLPSAFLLVQSKFYRFVTIEQISAKLSHFKNPDYVFVGDSIMEEGKNWWLRLGKFPFSSITIANNGYLTRQIAFLLDKAIELKPRYIFIMAGTNDLFLLGRSDEEIQADWQALLERTRMQKNIKFVITSLPITVDASYDKIIIKINKFLEKESQDYEHNFIDLNAILLSQNNNERSQYFTDGVHFSELTYKIWAEEINKIIDSEKNKKIRIDYSLINH